MRHSAEDHEGLTPVFLARNPHPLYSGLESSAFESQSSSRPSAPCDYAAGLTKRTDDVFALEVLERSAIVVVRLIHGQFCQRSAKRGALGENHRAPHEVFQFP